MTDKPVLVGPVYIAGPMSGLPDFNIPAFAAAEKWLLENYPGIEVKSPHHNSHVGGAPGDQPYGFYFRQGLRDLAECETLVTLEGFMGSTGARAEFVNAELMGIPRLCLVNSISGDMFLVDVSHIDFAKDSSA